jgi:hypothetical protein
MARESTQQKLSRVRAPRVQITYDVEVGNAIEMKELPFVMGVLGDLTGQPEKPLAALKDRKFVEINPDNFDSVLKGMAPHLKFSVENKLSSDPKAGQVGVDLHFESSRIFRPPKWPSRWAHQGIAGSADQALQPAGQPAGQRPTRSGALRRGFKDRRTEQAARRDGRQARGGQT